MRTVLTLTTLLAVAGCSGSPGVVAPPRDVDAARVPERDSGALEIDAGPTPIDPEIVRADRPPPPISGGTLAISSDGTIAVAADPDLDTISIVDLVAHATRTIALEHGEEPGRVAIDGTGRAHVVLRRGGTIADIDLATATLLERRAVCAAPRGIAWQPDGDSLHVACMDGLLVSLPARGGAPTRTLRVADDLRDVLVRGSELYVTRFRAAALIHVAPDGSIGVERRPAPAILPMLLRTLTPEAPFEPAVAWRAVPTATGALMLHQRAFSGEVMTDVGYGFSECGASVVHETITELRDDGTLAMGPVLEDVVLGVDLAVSPDGSRIAIAAPSNAYPRVGGGEIIFSRTHADVVVFASALLAGTTPDDPCHRHEAAPALGPSGGAVVAVAFLPDGRLVAQTRAPAAILIESTEPGVFPAIELSGTSALDTGHSMFHARTGAGIACASCHPEGGDDGRAWSFAEIGLRRTQTMRGGLLDTAPFHWDGDMTTFETLVEHVFVGRMGGAIERSGEAVVLGEWMHALPAFPRPDDADPAAIARGDALFHDATVGCTSCHAGAALTTSVSVDVGTGAAFQVPTLLGIAYRAPYMHQGCAPTLRDRFTDAACGGGDAHGRTSHLTPAQIDDLVAYVRTL